MFDLNLAYLPKRRQMRVSWLLLCLGISSFALPAFSQQVFIQPTCGKAGASASITGSGWAEPAPVCHYNFLFDGTAFAPQQPDGLFGPPNRVGTVPGNASAGNHTIKVELRVDSNNQLLQCRQDTFKVVTVDSDPFDGGKNVNPGGAPAAGQGNIKITFNPANACKVTACSQITMIQVLQMLGMHADGSTVVLKNTDLHFTKRPGFDDADVTPSPAGFAVDSADPSSPYYSAAYDGTDGQQSATPMSGVLIDAPSLPLDNFPDDTTITTVVYNFEDDFFCASGDNRGEFLGMDTWTWQKTRVSATGSGGNSLGVVTAHSSGNQNQPSQAFFDALSLFDKNHGFLFPTIAPKQLPPGQGGQACQ